MWEALIWVLHRYYPTWTPQLSLWCEGPPSPVKKLNLQVVELGYELGQFGTSAHQPSHCHVSSLMIWSDILIVTFTLRTKDHYSVKPWDPVLSFFFLFFGEEEASTFFSILPLDQILSCPSQAAAPALRSKDTVLHLGIASCQHRSWQVQITDVHIVFVHWVNEFS